MATVQDIQNIKVKDLCLWTENPRDPIDTNVTDAVLSMSTTNPLCMMATDVLPF